MAFQLHGSSPEATQRKVQWSNSTLSLSARFAMGPGPTKTLPVGESFGSSVKVQSTKCAARAGSASGNAWTTAPTKVQSLKLKPGFFGHADQLVVPTKRQSVKRAICLGPLSASNPQPPLSTKLHRAKVRLRMGPLSPSMSTPAAGGLCTATRAEWLNSQAVKS